MIEQICPLKHSFSFISFCLHFFLSIFHFPSNSHPSNSMNDNIQMVPFWNCILFIDALKATGNPTGSLLLLSPSLLALSPKHQTGIYIHGYSSFMVFLISIVKYGTNLSIRVLSSFYAQHRLHQPLAELHSPSNKVYCASVKLNPVVQKMPDLTCMVMVLSYHILFCHVLLRGFHHLHIQITPK